MKLEDARRDIETDPLTPEELKFQDEILAVIRPFLKIGEPQTKNEFIQHVDWLIDVLTRAIDTAVITAAKIQVENNPSEFKEMCFELADLIHERSRRFYNQKSTELETIIIKEVGVC